MMRKFHNTLSTNPLRSLLRKCNVRFVRNDESMSHAPTLCLSMIVKDESLVIERCLSSLVALLDHWIIVDTGSSDNTIELIEAFFRAHRVPGQVYRRTWRNFGENREEALQLARPHGDYTMFIDADEVLVGENGVALTRAHGDKLRAELVQLEVDLALYKVQFQGCEYPRFFLARASLPFHWHDPMHEYLECDHECKKVLFTWIINRPRSDGARSLSGNKYENDVRVLKEHIAANGENPRWLFYLGQTQQCGGMHQDAIETYRKRLAIAEANDERVQERYMTCVRLGQLIEVYGGGGSAHDNTEALLLYLQAYDLDRDRAEAPLCAAQYLRLRQATLMSAELLKAAKRAQAQAIDGKLFVDEDSRTWRPFAESAILNTHFAFGGTPKKPAGEKPEAPAPPRPIARACFLENAFRDYAEVVAQPLSNDRLNHVRTELTRLAANGHWRSPAICSDNKAKLVVVEEFPMVPERLLEAAAALPFTLVPGLEGVFIAPIPQPQAVKYLQDKLEAIVGQSVYKFNTPCFADLVGESVTLPAELSHVAVVALGENEYRVKYRGDTLALAKGRLVICEGPVELARERACEQRAIALVFSFALDAVIPRAIASAKPPCLWIGGKGAEAKANAKRLKHALSRLGVQPVRVAACSTTTMPPSDWKLDTLEGEPLAKTRAQLAQLCSHLKALEEGVRRFAESGNHWFLVCEDTLTVDSSVDWQQLFADCPSNAQILQLCMSDANTWQRLAAYAQCGAHWYPWTLESWSASCYAITRDAAHAILQELEWFSGRVHVSQYEFCAADWVLFKARATWTLCYPWLSTTNMVVTDEFRSNFRKPDFMK